MIIIINSRHTKAHPQRRKNTSIEKCGIYPKLKMSPVQFSFCLCHLSNLCPLRNFTASFQFLCPPSTIVTSKLQVTKRLIYCTISKEKEEIQQMMNTRTSKQLVSGKLVSLKVGTLCCEVNFFYFTSYHCPCHPCIIVICRCYFVKVSLNHPQTTQVGFER